MVDSWKDRDRRIRRGVGPEADPEQVDSLARDEPFLAALCGYSVMGRIATGPHPGERVRAAGNRVDGRYTEAVTGRRCANLAGFSLHANVAVAASERRGLERFCRYTGRGPLATERLSQRSDDRLAYRLKRSWSKGTTHIILDPLQLIEKLTALVPQSPRPCVPKIQRPNGQTDRRLHGPATTPLNTWVPVAAPLFPRSLSGRGLLFLLYFLAINNIEVGGQLGWGTNISISTGRVFNIRGSDR